MSTYSEPNPSAKHITKSTGMRANDKRKFGEENLSSYVLSVSKPGRGMCSSQLP